MKIGYYSYYPNPWKGLARKMWEHHHHIFRLINLNLEEIEIYPMVKPQNKSKINRYLQGDTSVLVDGFRNIKFNFVEDNDLSYIEDIDALFLEPGRVFLMDEVFGAKNDRIEKAREYFINKVKLAISREIPILWYDGDADLMNSPDGNFASWLFKELNLNNYSKCTVIGPYEDPKGQINKFKFVPYNTDFTELPNTIVSSSKRSNLTTYFGSNYHRNSFIEHFNNVSKYGHVVIYGSSWNPKKFDSSIELNKAIWLAEDEFISYYNNSLFGLYGDNDLTNDYKHYTLRVAEYLKAGIYIVPDDKQYLEEKFEGLLTISKINETSISELRKDYINRVLYQREILQKTFDSNLYVGKYYYALKGTKE